MNKIQVSIDDMRETIRTCPEGMKLADWISEKYDVVDLYNEIEILEKNEQGTTTIYYIEKIFEKQEKRNKEQNHSILVPALALKPTYFEHESYDDGYGSWHWNKDAHIPITEISIPGTYHHTYSYGELFNYWRRYFENHKNGRWVEDKDLYLPSVRNDI